MKFDTSFTNEGENILKKKLLEFIAQFTYEEISTIKAVKERDEMIKKKELKKFILLEEKGIANKITQVIKKAKTKTQRK